MPSSKTIGLSSNAANAIKSATTDDDTDSGSAPSAGQVLTATSSTAATWQNPTNAMVLITSGTASASSALTFDGCFTSTYDAYYITFNDIIPATDGANFYFRYRDAGADATGNVDYGYTYTRIGASSAGGAGSIISNNAMISPSCGNYTYESTSGVMTIFPRTGSQKISISQQFSVKDDAYAYNESFSTRYVSATAMSGIKFLFSSGNITSGSIYIYGIKKS